jgi:hypothetical protein
MLFLDVIICMCAGNFQILQNRDQDVKPHSTGGGSKLLLLLNYEQNLPKNLKILDH